MGVRVTELPDGLEIIGGTPLESERRDSLGWVLMTKVSCVSR
jgi:hypothetical protein